MTTGDHVISLESAKWATSDESVWLVYFSLLFAQFRPIYSKSTFLLSAPAKEASRSIWLHICSARWMDGWIYHSAERTVCNAQNNLHREAKGRLALATNGKGLTPKAAGPDTDWPTPWFVSQWNLLYMNMRSKTKTNIHRVFWPPKFFNIKFRR